MQILHSFIIPSNYIIIAQGSTINNLFIYFFDGVQIMSNMLLLISNVIMY